VTAHGILNIAVCTAYTARNHITAPPNTVHPAARAHDIGKLIPAGMYGQRKTVTYGHGILLCTATVSL